MSVGATSSWNNSILFPDNESHYSGEEKEESTKAIASSVEIMDSVDRWSKVAHISSIDGLAKLDHYDSDNESDDSFEIVYGEEETKDNTLKRVNEDDRKPAAKPTMTTVIEETTVDTGNTL